MTKKELTSHKKNIGEKVKKREYPIDIPGGYYARNETEYKFDKMLRDHAQKDGKDAMYEHIRGQMDRNSLRRIEDAIDFIIEHLMAIEDKLNRP